MTTEQRVAMTIGNLILENASLLAQLDQERQKAATLDADLQALKTDGKSKK